MSKNTTIWTVVIIVIVIIAGGIWWYVASQNSTSTSSNTSTPTLSASASITSFNLEELNPPVTGTVDNTNYTVSLMVPKGTDVKKLTPTITLPSGDTVSPKSGVSQNFTNPVTYTVTASDGTTQAYTVTVTIPSASIKVSSKSGLGQFLTDSNGMTLYYFTKDTKGSGQSACTGSCATLWPPFSVPTVTVSSPLNVNSFTTVTRADGTAQLAYKGMPLYYYSKDKKAGDTLGQGVNKTWYVVKP